jgi:hypothetical protein
MGSKVKSQALPATVVVANDPKNHKGELKPVAGSMNDPWNQLVVNQAINSAWYGNTPDERRMRACEAVAGALAGFKPRDEAEGMLAAQLVASHNAAMECYRRAMIPEQSLVGRHENLTQANKLSRTYATLLEALNRHRGKGQQKVTVEHVHVHDGGQAIVGTVSAPAEGGGAQKKIGGQPHALGYAPGVTLPRKIEAEREAVPIASGEGP